MSTAIRMPKDDAEVGLLHDQDDSDHDTSPMLNSGQNNTSGNESMWPKDMIGRNLGAKMGTVASEKISIRMAFLRKVFGILSFQVVYTIAICVALYKTPGLQSFILHNAWVLLPLLFASLGLLLAMHFHARNVPTNYLLLIGFTTIQALTLGCVVSMYKLHSILEAACLTAVIVVALFFYTLQSRRDFVKGYALSFSLLSVLLMASMLQIFFMSPKFNFFISVFGAGLFCVFLIIDMDIIMHGISPEDYILACVTLYLDVVNLFIYLLQIIGEANR